MCPGLSHDAMKQIHSTVDRLPCAGFAEKDGSMTNSQRWLQWKNVALPLVGQARLDQDIIAQIFLKVRELYKKDSGKFPDPILNLTWPYTDPLHPALADLAKEINGKALADLEDPKTKQQVKAGQQLPGFAWLRDDGTTSCGNWIYSGCWPQAGNHIPRRTMSRLAVPFRTPSTRPSPIIPWSRSTPRKPTSTLRPAANSRWFAPPTA